MKRPFGDVKTKNAEQRVVQEAFAVVHALSVDVPPIESSKITLYACPVSHCIIEDFANHLLRLMDANIETCQNHIVIRVGRR